jgi:hypothetical protein
MHMVMGYARYTRSPNYATCNNYKPPRLPFNITYIIKRGSLVVKALGYKPEGHGF